MFRLLLLLYLPASLATFIAYAIDKRAAINGRRRIRERTLHLFELCGGWPGALLAQRTLRHKTIDPTFRRVFWLIVALHAIAWTLILYRMTHHN